MSTPAQTLQIMDTRYTQDVIAVLDTSKFEHMQRIAMVMAKGSTIPNSLKYEDGDLKCPLPDDVVIANCFRIVNQAVRWGMDPFAVMDCASIIHGRLMWEGKLVAAVLDAKLGVRLNYRFDEKQGQNLGITVYATLPGESAPREIYGQVKDWHRGPKSPWAQESAWRRQLRYMGNREWARAHAPAIMLGVYTDDELDEIASRDVPAGMRAAHMKTISAPKAVLDIPDIPDVAPATSSEVDDAPLDDPDHFVASLKESIAVCSTDEERAEVADANRAVIERLPKAQRDKAKKLLSKIEKQVAAE